jgi:hypothetical protein
MRAAQNLPNWLAFKYGLASPVSHVEELGLACDTRISDSSTWPVPTPVDPLVRVQDV